MEVPEGGDFPLESLPYGVVRPVGGPARVGVAVGESVLDLAAVAQLGLLDDLDLPAGLFASDSLNGFLALGPAVWAAVRSRLSRVLESEERAASAILRQADVELLLPFAVGDYVDFYASEHHARNMGRMLRGDQDPLLPNWRHLPVGYHGRAATVVVSGEPVPRPRGMVRGPDGVPRLAPTSFLDIEAEVGFVVGVGNQRGTRIPCEQAGDHVFGVVLVNDWSARDIQLFEYQPLGPFLAKSFATSISPWVMPLAALAPYLVDGPVQDPTPEPYLSCPEPRGLDLHLEVSLNGTVVSRTNARELYWSMAQQLAHLTVNGAATRTGDLFASGTVSGAEPGTYGSLVELTWRGEHPIALADGTTRIFLEDGDAVSITGWCGGDGRPRLGLGRVTGTITPARED